MKIPNLLLFAIPPLIVPEMQLLIWLGLAIIIDFITGVIKAIFNHENRTSAGYRKTVQKFTQYAGAILIGFMMMNITNKDGFSELSKYGSYLTSGLISFIIGIEITSILENMVEIAPNSVMTNKIFKPMLKLMTLSLNMNPIKSTADLLNDNIHEGSSNSNSADTDR